MNTSVRNSATKVLITISRDRAGECEDRAGLRVQV